jgi:hypothetical protein
LRQFLDDTLSIRGKIPPVRRLIPLFVVVALAAVASAAAAPRLNGPLTFKVRLIQEATIRHQHPPAGDPGDTFSTTLKLYAIGTVLGFPDGTPMGRMSFTWGPLRGECSASASGCSGTTNILTVTSLPGGTISAGGTNVSLSKGIVVPVTNGTGIFKGVKGSIQIAPSSTAEDVFKLTLPS